MQWTYDGQIRRYLTQVMRILSNFPVKDGRGNLREVPVLYGDLSRQVANIIRENSENKLPSAPRISVYITGLELDRDRLGDASYVQKTNIRERAYDAETGSYLNYQGKNYTVERLMPTPYILRLNADIWASNTDQKLQILEQLLVFFHPSLEIQTTDNFIDWTSVTVVNLDNVNWSNRSIPVGVDSEIDIASLTFSIPIYINSPAKVKKLGVITNIITSIFDESRGTIEDGMSTPEVNQYDDFTEAGTLSSVFGTTAQTDLATQMANVNYDQYDVYLHDNTAQLVTYGAVGEMNWRVLLETLPGTYIPGVSRLELRNLDNNSSVTGTVSLDDTDETLLNIDFDPDTFPSDTVIEGKTNVDYIIDPTTFNPSEVKEPGLRLLILENISSNDALEFPSAWKNNDGSGFIAEANDLIEWDGNQWKIVFDASESNTVVYTTNLRTGVQYRFKNGEWLLSVEGTYPVGTWSLILD